MGNLSLLADKLDKRKQAVVACGVQACFEGWATHLINRKIVDSVAVYVSSLRNWDVVKAAVGDEAL